MPNLNKADVMGHIGREPEVRHLNNGKAVCNFSIATNNSYKKDGEWVEQPPTWHNVSVFGELAEVIAMEFSKGDAIRVEGKIRHREYDAKDGTKRQVSEILAGSVVYKPVWVRKVKEKAESGEDQFISDIQIVMDDDADVPF